MGRRGTEVALNSQTVIADSKANLDSGTNAKDSIIKYTRDGKVLGDRHRRRRKPDERDNNRKPTSDKKGRASRAMATSYKSFSEAVSLRRVMGLKRGGAARMPLTGLE